MAKLSIFLGVLALIVSLLPLAHCWFLAISWLYWGFGALSVIFGIIGLIKKKKSALFGIVLSICAGLAPVVFAEQYAVKAVEAASDAVGGVMKLTEGIMDMTQEDSDN